MARILAFTTDLPYFPGKNGHDFFNLRFLATRHEVSVVAPVYETALKEGILNLEQAVQHVLMWPRPVAGVPLFIHTDAPHCLPQFTDRLPARFRRWLLHRLLGIHRAPRDAYERLAIQSNCAVHLLTALHEGSQQAIVLIQSNLQPCLDYLPGPGARIIYFHDVRCDYLSRARGSVGPSRQEVQAITRQEVEACRRSDAVGFVSELDRQRAVRLLKPTCEVGVANIPVDTNYFVPAPSDWPAPPHPAVLFTGHLSHPPNVDAVKYFLAEVWPLVLQELPNARFMAAGLLPADDLAKLAATVPNFELHGNVPDIRPFFWNAKVYVVPMRFGGGVRQKIFEAWSMRVPVVCTTMAAEGVDARSGENCWLEDSPAALAGRIVSVIKSTDQAKVATAAKVQVDATRSIPVAAGEFVSLVEKAIAIRKKRPFRLLYDLRWMEIGKSGGTEQMTHELLGALSHLDHRNEYRLYCPRSTFHEWDFPPEFRVSATFSDANEKMLEGIHAATVNRLAVGLGASPVLTHPMRTLRKLHRLDFDLVHAMVGYLHPDLSAFPHVLTALDLQHIHYPDFFSPEEWQERDRLYRESAARARHILCISEYTRQDMHRLYGVPLEKMSTVWIIPSQRSAKPMPAPIREKLIAQMGIRGPFLFFPAHCWPHKNHAKLVEAFALILPHIPAEMKLVFSGRPFPADHPAELLIRQFKLEQRVFHLGYRSPLEVQALYQSCFLLVFPSLFEGFGLPVAEAILAGKPVACSNCTSLPEIAGPAGHTFDPNNIHDIGGRLLEIINDSDRYAALTHATTTQRRLFSARLSAMKTLAVYQQVYDEIYS